MARRLFLHQEAPELDRQLPSAAVAKGPWLRVLAVAAGMNACRMQTDLRGTGALVSSTEKGWRWQPALQLLQAAHLQNMQPSTIVLSPVASACEKSAQWQIPGGNKAYYFMTTSNCIVFVAMVNNLNSPGEPWASW